MIFAYRSYRDILKAHLVERKRANGSYSLRAMAAHLGFSSSQLSEAMSGKANFSQVALKKVARRMRLTQSEASYFCTLADWEHAKDADIRQELVEKLKILTGKSEPFHDLSIDTFKQISDWHHSAILELVNIPGFFFSPALIAKTIGIPKPEAELAVERLERLKLIEKVRLGRYRRLQPALQIRSTEKSSAMRTFYRQMLEKVSVSLDEQEPGERWSGYETIAISEDSLPEIRAACDRFFEDVLSIAKKYPEPTNVFHLVTHLFNLTPARKRK